MTIYNFYLKINNLDLDGVISNLVDLEYEVVDDIEGEDVVLYAYTTSKNMAELFMCMRNMDMFIPVKYKLSKKEYHDYSDENVVGKLIEIDLDTVSKRGKISSFPALLTTGEASMYYDFLGDAEDIFRPLFLKSVCIKDILPLIKKSWRKEIGWKNFLIIDDMADDMLDGMNVPVYVNGIYFLLNYLGELF